MEKQILPALPQAADPITQDFWRRSLEHSMRGSVKRDRELAYQIEQTKTETSLLYSVMDVADLTGMPIAPGIVVFVQNAGGFYYYNTVALAWEPTAGGIGGGDAETLDGIDSTGFALVGHSHGAPSLVNDSVTNAILADMAAATVKGQIVGGSGDPVDLSAAQLNAIVGSDDLTLSNHTLTLANSSTSGVPAIDIGNATRYWSVHVAGTSGKLTVRDISAGVDRLLLDLAGLLTYNGNGTFDGSGDTTITTNSTSASGLPNFQLGNATRYWSMRIDGTSGKLIIKDISAGLDRLSLDVSGNLALGPTAAQGRFHVHDGTGGALFVTKTGIGTTAQVLIANGTGDVTKVARVQYAVEHSGGNSSVGYVDLVVSSGDVAVYINSGNTLSMRVNADGSMDARRTAGSGTFTLVAWVVWR